MFFQSETVPFCLNAPAGLISSPAKNGGNTGCSTRAGARPRGVLRTMGDLGSIEPKLLRWASSARMALGHLLRALQVKEVVLESARWLRTWRLMGNLPVLADVGMLCMIISTYSAKMRLVIPSPLVCTHQGAQWFTPSVRPCARPRPRALDWVVSL